MARIKGLLITLLVLTILIWSFLAHGPTPLGFGVTWESLAFGVATALKLVSMLVAGVVLLSTTRVEEIFLALVKLRLPYPACFAFAMALRWVPEVLDTALRVKEAQQARGLDLESGGRGSRLKRHIPLLVPIFLLTLRRSQTMAWALEAKGFNCGRQRTYLLDIRFTGKDFLALTLGLMILGGFVAVHLAGMDRIPGLVL
ncbi:MAG: energy-coupling factor transporter transmembrane component T [Desulfobacca sp.]|nr:energy-coupling factor transporter transmembrane component T [Desulfobacca sp.]